MKARILVKLLMESELNLDNEIYFQIRGEHLSPIQVTESSEQINEDNHCYDQATILVLLD